ncbi:MAG: putative motility protein [Parvibaculum sp.]|nr:putative motility protein [Parvibaculum sp.]
MSDLASIVAATSQSQTQAAMQIAMLKAGHEQGEAVANMLSAAVEQVKAAAPQGMGHAVDVSV